MFCAGIDILRSFLFMICPYTAKSPHKTKYFGIVSRPPTRECGSKGQVSSPKKNHAATETARDLWLDACPVFLKMQFELRSGREKLRQKRCSQFKSKFRTVLYLFIFAFSFQEQNLPRASFAAAAKNEFVASGTCWGFRSPIPRILWQHSLRCLL